MNPNTGVWLLRSCPESFAFLDSVEDAGPQPGPWADQGAVRAALGWDRGDERYHWARPGPGSRHLSGTSWLPTGWNQPYVDGRCAAESFNSGAGSYRDRPRVDDPHALHFMGMSPAARYRAMGEATPLLHANDLHGVDSTAGGARSAALRRRRDARRLERLGVDGALAELPSAAGAAVGSGGRRGPCR